MGTQNTDKNVQQQELLFMAGGMQNGATTLGCSLGVLIKLNIPLLYSLAIIILGIHSVLKASVHTRPEPYVYGSFIHDYQSLNNATQYVSR